MDIIRLDDQGLLYLSPDIDDWQAISLEGITAIFDLDGGIDEGVPTLPNHTVYVYFPFNDAELPDVSRLHALAKFGAALVRGGTKVLAHCGLGFNRSALLAGLILRYLGMPGPDVVAQLRERRPGALYNATYATYLATCELQA